MIMRILEPPEFHDPQSAEFQFEPKLDLSGIISTNIGPQKIEYPSICLTSVQLGLAQVIAISIAGGQKKMRHGPRCQ